VNPWVEPNKIYAGIKVKIPRQLLKNQKAMPRDFVLSSTRKGKDDSQQIQKNQSETLRSPGEEKTRGSYMEFVVP
jgi:hypothetical protein